MVTMKPSLNRTDIIEKGRNNENQKILNVLVNVLSKKQSIHEKMETGSRL